MSRPVIQIFSGSARPPARPPDRRSFPRPWHLRINGSTVRQWWKDPRAGRTAAAAAAIWPLEKKTKKQTQHQKEKETKEAGRRDGETRVSAVIR